MVVFLCITALVANFKRVRRNAFETQFGILHIELGPQTLMVAIFIQFIYLFTLLTLSIFTAFQD